MLVAVAGGGNRGGACSGSKLAHFAVDGESADGGEEPPVVGWQSRSRISIDSGRRRRSWDILCPAQNDCARPLGESRKNARKAPRLPGTGRSGPPRRANKNLLPHSQNRGWFAKSAGGGGHWVSVVSCRAAPRGARRGKNRPDLDGMNHMHECDAQLSFVCRGSTVPSWIQCLTINRRTRDVELAQINRLWFGIVGRCCCERACAIGIGVTADQRCNGAHCHGAGIFVSQNLPRSRR